MSGIERARDRGSKPTALTLVPSPAWRSDLSLTRDPVSFPVRPAVIPFSRLCCAQCVKVLDLCSEQAAGSEQQSKYARIHPGLGTS